MQNCREILVISQIKQKLKITINQAQSNINNKRKICIFSILLEFKITKKKEEIDRGRGTGRTCTEANRRGGDAAERRQLQSSVHIDRDPDLARVAEQLAEANRLRIHQIRELRAAPCLRFRQIAAAFHECQAIRQIQEVGEAIQCRRRRSAVVRPRRSRR